MEGRSPVTVAGPRRTRTGFLDDDAVDRDSGPQEVAGTNPHPSAVVMTSDPVPTRSSRAADALGQERLLSTTASRGARTSASPGLPARASPDGLPSEVL